MSTTSNKNTNRKALYLQEQHPFHLVNPSPWPFVVSCSVFSIVLGLIFVLHLDKNTSTFSLNQGPVFMAIGVVSLIYTIYRWFKDVVTEATIEGHHTVKVQQGLRYGVILFIVSEIMFFVGFFWAFFHSSLSPSIAIGCVWPPKDIEVLNPFELPFLNTLILLSSGVSITWAHRALLAANWRSSVLALAITILLGLIFTACQGFEYYSAPFSIQDGIYGSVFYLATGFHGFHVIVGTIMLSVALWRAYHYHFTRQHHLGFEAAAWYWHFVDVVWIFLFTTLYWWGS